MVDSDATRCRKRALLTPLTIGVGAIAVAAIVPVAPARADNLRLNQGVITNVDTIKKQAGCKTDLKLNLQLQYAAQLQADDMLSNRNLDGDTGTDGSTVQDRARTAGYHGNVADRSVRNEVLTAVENKKFSIPYPRGQHSAGSVCRHH